MAFVWDVYKKGDISTKVPVTNNKFNVPAYDVIISGTVVDTYTVTYDCNGGTSGCPSNVSGLISGTNIILADAPTKAGNVFNGWSDGTTTRAAGSEYTVTGNVTMTAQWTAGATGIIYFGTAEGCLNFNATTTSGWIVSVSEPSLAQERVRPTSSLYSSL